LIAFALKDMSALNGTGPPLSRADRVVLATFFFSLPWASPAGEIRIGS
jgi:hypothetical protein